MWESRSDFQGLGKTMENLPLVFLVFHASVISMALPVPFMRCAFRTNLPNSFPLAACIPPPPECPISLEPLSGVDPPSDPHAGTRPIPATAAGSPTAWRTSEYTRFTLPFGRHLLLWHCAGPMKVQIRIKMLAIELVEGFRMRRADMAVADVLANYPSVFRLRQSVVVAVARPRLGLLHQ